MAGLEGKVSLVTGGGAGIGRAIALRLAGDGSSVAIADINPDWAEATARQVREAGGAAETFEFDLASTSSIEGMVAAVYRRYPRVDVLVNNAGVNGSLGMMEVTAEEWDRVVGINARGTFFCLQAVARRMIEDSRGGRIISLASIAAKGFRRSSSLPYSASKAAVVAMTRFAALQLATHGINVNAICPGPTRSDLFTSRVKQYADEQGVSIEAAFDVFDEFIPLKRSNEPMDIAATVAFLASDDARNITGQSFNVDGGLTWD
jgi:NAD(P)-dependent dehydrogenase (short-subunit alcohol dehydrogenase family)